MANVIERVERGRDVIEFVIEKVGVGVGGDANRCVPHGYLQRAEIGTGTPRERRVCVTNIEHAHFVSADLGNRHFQWTDRFQFSSPGRDPRGGRNGRSAGWPAIESRLQRSTRRSGMGTDRLPASDFGLPSTSRPLICVIERRIRMRLAAMSMSSTFNPVSSPNRKPV